jgi:aminoglycoside 3-N-acetyltransferase
VIIRIGGAIKVTVKKDICDVLYELGICGCDIVLLHSSLSSIERMEGGADAVIEAFIETLGTDGTLVMPAFSDDISTPFDPEVTPSDTGIITEKFRNVKGVIRSLHPTHSVCAYGKFAAEITENHDKAPTPCGKGTPFDKICNSKGKIVLLGVDMNRNTILHAAEDIAEMPYLIRNFNLPAPTYSPKYPNGILSIQKMPLGHRDFLKLTPVLRRKNMIKEMFIGSAAVKVMDADKLLEISLDILHDDPGFFLCNNNYCNSCMASRNKITGNNNKIFKENRCKMDFCEVCMV